MALNDKSIINRGSTSLPHLQGGCDKLLAAGTIGAHRLCILGTGGTLTQGTAGATTVVGVNDSMGSVVAGQYVPLADGWTLGIADDVLTPGWWFKCGDGGRCARFVDAAAVGGTIKTTGNGIGFANQPANDGVEIVSASAADTTQSITIIGTTTGTDTVVVETVDLDGTTPVSTVKVDWGFILAVKLSASCAGTITVREASGDAAITTILTTVLSKGVEAVTAANQQAYNVAPTVVASDTTTKQIGLGGTNSAGTQIYDSQALNNTTAVTMNSAFKRVTEVYTGDLESNRTVTVAVGAAEADEKKVGRVITATTAQDQAVGIKI